MITYPLHDEFSTQITTLSRQQSRTSMNAFVNVESGLLREPFVTNVALEGTLAGVRSHVDFEVRLACERGRALNALVRAPLHWLQTRYLLFA